MEAANLGAFEDGGVSVGLPALGLDGERSCDNLGNFHTHKSDYIKFMFVRRFAIAIRSEALIFSGGGIGTLDELFEHIMLIQTKTIHKIPIIITNKKLYNGVLDFLKKTIEPEGYVKLSEIEDIICFEEDIGKNIEIVDESRV